MGGFGGCRSGGRGGSREMRERIARHNPRAGQENIRGSRVDDDHRAVEIGGAEGFEACQLGDGRLTGLGPIRGIEAEPVFVGMHQQHGFSKSASFRGQGVEKEGEARVFKTGAGLAEQGDAWC